ncbi:alpha/beta hydrolase [Smaragdicoccus niigatensis]|uniref:alpha/beta hydrolase n=1 Tax=Smaragdicoccus niigatensis TaxID=359359 RepID=UPI0003617AA0
MRIVDCSLRATVKTFLRLWALTSTLPWPTWVVDHAGRVLSPVKGVSQGAVELPRCTATLYSPPAIDSDRCVLYLHGGAFMVGGRHLHRNMIGRITERVSAPVLAVDYRKMPKHTISEAIEDCIGGYLYLLERGIPADRITIMGDSAGGYLSLVLGSVLQDNGLPQPGAIVVMSPLTDLDHSDKLAAPTNCALFPSSAVIAFTQLMSRRAGGRLISPVHANLTDFPPTLLHVGRREYLYPDSVLMAKRLRSAGRVCHLHTWDTAVHVFQAAGHTPEAVHALDRIVDFVDQHVPRALSRRAL